MIRKSQQSFRKLLPWYVNRSLSALECEAVEAGISRDDRARAEVDAWKQIQTAVTSQPQRMPSSQVRQRLMAIIREPTASFTRVTRPSWSLFAGALLTLSVLILLWLAVRPGVVLQWSLERDRMTSYRIYRASHGSSQFELVTEIPAQANRLRYSFVDALLMPGRNYIYRVEGIHADGVSTFSQIVNSHSQDVLPGQLALILTSVIIGYGIVIVMRQWTLLSQRKVMEHFT
jgi:hypothetical protein